MIDPSKIKEDLVNLKEPLIVVGGEITKNLYRETLEKLLYLTSKNSPSVTIVINSSGGEVSSGFAIYDAIRLYQGATTALVMNQASSMAAVVLQACHNRYCAKHANILIHYCRSLVALDELTSKKVLKEKIASLTKSQKMVDDILALRTGQSVSKIREVCRLNKSMTAEEALDFGLIDKIV